MLSEAARFLVKRMGGEIEAGSELFSDDGASSDVRLEETGEMLVGDLGNSRKLSEWVRW